MIRRSLAIFFVSLALTCTSLVACGVTPGRAIEFAVVAEGSAGTFTTTTGWEVTLREAFVAVGPLYAFAPDDAVARARALLLPVAHAHGGEGLFGMRPVRGELTEQVLVDALAERSVLGTAHGSAGPTLDLTLLLDAPHGELASATSPLRGHHLWVAGSATQGSTEVSFEGGLDIPDEGMVRLVESIPLEGEADEGAELVVSMHVSAWLDDAHFDRLPEASEGPRVIAAGAQPHTALYLGARSARAWSARWIPSPQPEGVSR